MSKNSKVDKELLSILDDYHLFMDSDKTIDMPFCVNKVDNNHITSLKGETDLRAACPFVHSFSRFVVKSSEIFSSRVKNISIKGRFVAGLKRAE